ncbi:glycine-rich protein [Musa troglodytarum]|uniref:Glycine-rich protein n=1 Tax=Musa troglodytarum TaxID=320322 RepID=A0A9E7JYG2_9LILI|nr:glycine-rich protein [Musa troglodytarum]
MSSSSSFQTHKLRATLREQRKNQTRERRKSSEQSMERTGHLFVLLLLLLAAASTSSAARDLEAELAKGKGKGQGRGGIPEFGADPGGFFGPGSGFNMPGFGGGWGAGYGGPTGGYSRGGVVRPSVVCSDKGPCYKKRLTCPAKCFSSFSHSGKGYGAGGGGGGCTIDCKKRCVAYC